MWGLVPDLSKLGSSLGEALQKAKDDMEKNIDSSLGIGEVPAAAAADAGASPEAANAALVDTAPAAPAGKVMRKVMRKVVKKVLRPAPGPDSAAAATVDPSSEASQATPSSLGPARSLTPAPSSAPPPTDGATPAAPEQQQQQQHPDLPPALAPSSHLSPSEPPPSPGQPHSSAGDDTSSPGDNQQDTPPAAATAAPPGPPPAPAEAPAHIADAETGHAPLTAPVAAGESPPGYILNALSAVGSSDGTMRPPQTRAHTHQTSSIRHQHPHSTPNHRQQRQHPPPLARAQQGLLGASGNGVRASEVPPTASGLEPHSASPAEEGVPMADASHAEHDGNLSSEAHRSGPHPNDDDDDDEPRPSVHGNGGQAGSSQPPTSSSSPSSSSHTTTSQAAPSPPHSDSPALAQQHEHTTAASHPTTAALPKPGPATTPAQASAPTAPTAAPSPVSAPPAAATMPAPPAASHPAMGSGGVTDSVGGGGGVTDSVGGGGGGGGAECGGGDAQAAALGELRAELLELSCCLATREAQLLKQATQMSDLQQVSENDLEELRSEFEVRLAAGERKVYALSKERDALRKGAEKLAEYGATIREREETIKQLMGEGEKLSRKHAELEGTLRKLRSSGSEVAADRDRLLSRLAAEEATSEGARKARAKAERDLAVAEAAARAEAEAGREALEAAVAKGKVEQAEGEERAREAAAAGVARQLKDSEARCAALAESVGELREALDRQRQAADLREEMLKADISDLERRSNAAEMRHQDLTAKLPDAMRPLLRQIEAMQAAAQAQAEAWSGAERALEQRISEAESTAAAAMEKERLGADRTSVLHSKVQSLEGALAAARAEVRSLAAALEAGERGVAEARESSREMAHQVELLQERGRIMGMQMAQAALSASELLTTERGLRDEAESDAATVRKECERRLVDSDPATQDGRGATHMARLDGPTMAAPGYRWVLLKEGQEPASMHPPSSPQPLSYTQHHQTATNVSTRAPSPNYPTGSSPFPNLHSHASHKLRPHDEDAPALDSGSDLDPTPSPFSGPSNQPHHHSSHGAAARASRCCGALPVAAARCRPAGVGGYEGSGGAGGGAGTGHRPLTSAEMEGLRASLRQKTGEAAALEAHVRELEATRDRLAEELVSSSHKIEAAADCITAMERMRTEAEGVRVRYAAAMELLGERDERLEELSADLRDVKSLYQDQIEFFVLQLSALEPPVQWDPVVEGEEGLTAVGGGLGGGEARGLPVPKGNGGPGGESEAL
ncbi:MAG: hypothetical protein WDW38_008644 [Sanguina aurantia]